MQKEVLSKKGDASSIIIIGLILVILVMSGVINIPALSGKIFDYIPTDNSGDENPIVSCTDKECDDLNPCTSDSCSGQSCLNVKLSDGTACPNGHCVIGECSDTCGNGACEAWETLGNCASDCAVQEEEGSNGSASNLTEAECEINSQCDDSNACTIDSCSSEGCLNLNAANGTECLAGYCVSGECSDTCGNGACDSWENESLCADDCIEILTLSSFTDGSEQKSYTYELPGDNSTIMIELPRNATISFATVDIAGEGILKSFNLVSASSRNVSSTAKVLSDDYDNDGEMDLVLLNYPGTIYRLLGNNDCTFNAPVNYTGFIEPGYPEQGDIDNDGDIDFVFVSGYGSKLQFIKNNGYASFSIGANTSITYSSDFTLGDFDKDGKLDIVSVRYNAGQITFSKGYGNGSFMVGSSFTAKGNPYSIASGYANSDGNLDILLTDKNSKKLLYFEGNGDGTFKPYAEFSVTGYPEELLVADFNSDSRIDAAIVYNDARTLAIYLNNGYASFYLDGTYTYSYLDQPEVMDIDNDGDLDIMLASVYVNKIVLFLNNGDGSFESTPITFSTSESPYDIVSGDFDSDGKADTAVTGYANNLLEIFRNQPSTPYYTTDTALLFGSVQSNNWTLGGQLTDLQTIDLKSMINAVLQDCSCLGCSISAGGNNCMIRLNISSITPGSVELSGLNVKYTE
jgi:hypothetical protein